jgi:hypothetical protein
LLLKIGEVGRKVQSGEKMNRTMSNLESSANVKSDSGDKNEKVNDEAENSQIPRSATFSNDKEAASSKINNLNETAKENEPEWYITFEQLLASILTDNLLIDYFDNKYDLDKKLAEYKSQHA